MRWNDLQDEACPIARTMSVVGDRWTFLILRDALRGISRFEEFHQRLKCSRATLADRIALLVERGVLEREQYETHPPRHDYRLTEMGRALAPVMMTMSQWAETWLPVSGKQRIKRVHRGCGHAFQPVLHCSECGERVMPGDVTYSEPQKAR